MDRRGFKTARGDTESRSAIRTSSLLLSLSLFDVAPDLIWAHWAISQSLGAPSDALVIYKYTKGH